jgi:CTP:molybdopterin cytidylyltransferase MocA
MSGLATPADAPAEAPAPPHWANRWFCLAVLAASLALHLAFSLQGLNNRPLDGHEFRQTQTALSIRHLAQEGLSIDYPLPVLGKPWSLPLEFPLYQWSAVVASRVTGLELEPAARLTGVLYFYLSLPAVFLLVRRLGIGADGASLTVACVLTCPLYLFYPRAIMIESTALCFSLWFVLALWRHADHGAIGWLAVALMSGMLAAVVKLTTFAVFLGPAAIVLVMAFVDGRRRPAAWGAAAAGLALLAGVGWSRYADAVKARNPLAGFLRSSEIGPWAFGDFGDRFRLPLWETFASVTGVVAHAVALVVALVFLSQAPRRIRIAALLLAACYLCGPLVFTTLYRIHDYYFFASAVFLLAGVGMSLGRVLDSNSIPLAARYVVVLVVLGSGVLTFGNTYRKLLAPNEDRVPETARVLAAGTADDDVVLVLGHDWNPMYPYLAVRRALMIPDHSEANSAAVETALRNLENERVGALLVVGSTPRRQALARTLVARFALTAEPVARSTGAGLHIAQAGADANFAKLSALPLGEYSLQVPSGRVSVASLSPQERHHFRMFTPLPVELKTPFGVSSGMIGDEPFFNAHAPVELVLPVPAGAKRLVARFGVLDGESITSPQGTDGVVFEAHLIATTGQPKPLARTWLKPRQEAADRGTKSWDVPLPDGFTGKILLRTDPGPDGNASFDWSYWSRVVIE